MKDTLTPEALYQHCDLSQFVFATTDDLTPLDVPLGQQRALEAIEFGIDIEHDGYNLFVLGGSGLGKHQLVQQIVAERAASEAPRSDWCYINNFDDAQKPKVLQLPVGMGQKFRKDMESLTEDLLTSLPSSFQSEEYRNRRQEIEGDFQERQEQAFKQLDKDAEERGIAIKRTPTGYTLGPVIDGQLYGPEEFKKLPIEEQQRLEKLIADIQIELQDIIRDMPLLQREHHQRIKALNQEITQHTVEQLIAWIENVYRDNVEISNYLAAAKKHAIENVEFFLPNQNSPNVEDASNRVAEFHEYRVNVIVDNTDTIGAPVVYEDNPTYQNLIGRVEYVSQMGTLLTDFTLIKSGALLRANGGYLILDAQKVLTHAFAWEGLKRVLKAQEIKIESLEEMLSLASTLSLEPESIPVKVKVILTGEPTLYYLLKEYDREFSQLFKVAADFSQVTERNADSVNLYARLIASLQKRNGTRSLDRDSVGRIIEHASRAADDSEKLSLHVESLTDLLHEADYWAGKSKCNSIRLEDVEKAIEKRRYRQDKYRELMQEQIIREIKLIDTDGQTTAQVNALSVLQVGDYSFGQPSRITATARLGRGGVIDIEREVKLGGHLHSKGVMILSSYLASCFAPDQPLPLSASLVFEQSYGMVDGDSASAAELCVLLSALGNIPLKQSLAVTGSINQRGEIQAIGGVNEKIEGFFDICRARGLTGSQGVIIPAANKVHLMLSKDVREAVTEHRFHIYTADHVNDVIELLSGQVSGVADSSGQFPENSINRHVKDRIDQLQSLHQKYAGQGDEKKADPDGEDST
jgi:predicted ATP-dependent protease